MTFTADQVRAWRNGAEGFLAWIRDVQPKIPARKGGFAVFVPADFQEEGDPGSLGAGRRSMALSDHRFQLPQAS